MATGVGAEGARRVGLRSPLNTRIVVARSAIVLVGLVAAVSLIAPLRRDASNAASRVIFWVMAPLAPSIGGFSAFPQPTRVLAADGSELGRIDGPEGSQQVALASLPPYVP